MNKVRLQVIVPALNKRHRLPPPGGDPDGIEKEVHEGFSFIGNLVPQAEMQNGARGKWYKDQEGFFYSNAGLLVIDEFIAPTAHAVAAMPAEAEERVILAATQEDINRFLSIAQFPSEVIDFHQLVHLPSEIKKQAGSGIKIAVLDTGVENRHLDLDNKIISTRDFTGSAAGTTDGIGHGTSMASLIAAKRFFDDKGISGVAPLAEIISAKVIYDRNDPGDFLSVGQGIHYAIEQRADVVNLSIGRRENVAAVAEIIKTAANANLILVAATRHFDQSLPLMQFPCNCPEVIPVSSMSRKNIVDKWNNLPAPLIILPNNRNWTCSVGLNNYYFEDSGSSSAATAIISGIIALLVSNQPSIKRSKADILSELSKYASTVEEAYDDLNKEICFVYKS